MRSSVTLALILKKKEAVRIAPWVLSIVFRKFVSEKMKYTPILRRWSGYAPLNCRGAYAGGGVKGGGPFILTLDSVGGICYLIAVLMPPLLRLRSDISCKDTALIPTPSPKHTAVWHRPASEQSFHQGMYQRLLFCVVSHGSSVQ